MATYRRMTSGTGGDEGEQKRRARQQKSSRRKQAAARAMQKLKDRKENLKKTAKSVGKELALEAAMAGVPAFRLLGAIPKASRIAGKAVKGKKVKVKGLKKSRARAEAETDVRSREFGRSAARRSKEENQMSKTKLARSPKRQKAAKRQMARESASTARKPGIPGDTKAFFNKAADKFDKWADSITERKVALRRKSARSYKNTDKSRNIQEAGKELIEARKKLAATPRYGGKYRVKKK